MQAILYLFSVIFLLSCSGVPSNTQNYEGSDEVTQEKALSISLDNLLSGEVCGNQFVFNEGAFYFPDYGCIYDSSIQKLGNANVFLVPRKHLPTNIGDEWIEKEEERINQLAVSELKKEFEVVVFLVEPKYLRKVDNGEGVYSASLPYQEDCYIVGMDGTWRLENSYSISSLEEEQEMNLKMWKKVNDLRL